MNVLRCSFMERIDFEHCIETAIAELPEKIREHLNNADVVIVVEDYPVDKPAQGLLLGLYEGIPLTAWGRGFAEKLPDKITLFKENIEAVARDPSEVPHLIKETLLHEIAHYFGFDHDTIHIMEKRWRGKREQKKT